MQIIELNHVAVYVKNLEKSSWFYGEILGLERIERPAFTFPGAWFRLGTKQELHLIATRKEEISIIRQNHFALKVHSAADAEVQLKNKGIAYLGPKPRPDGAIQLFIQDPDGYYIELFELNQVE